MLVFIARCYISGELIIIDVADLRETGCLEFFVPVLILCDLVGWLVGAGGGGVGGYSL